MLNCLSCGRRHLFPCGAREGQYVQDRLRESLHVASINKIAVNPVLDDLDRTSGFGADGGAAARHRLERREVKTLGFARRKPDVAACIDLCDLFLSGQKVEFAIRGELAGLW